VVRRFRRSVAGDSESQVFLEKSQKPGTKSIYAHNGPTIWPFAKDSFDVKDIDYAASTFPTSTSSCSTWGRRGSKTFA
jgi:hypothetical protein